jgi:hypothetical protein
MRSWRFLGCRTAERGSFQRTRSNGFPVPENEKSSDPADTKVRFNHLIHEKALSPSTCGNPVDWHPWGRRLFKKRRKRINWSFCPSATPIATGAT